MRNVYCICNLKKKKFPFYHVKQYNLWVCLFCSEYHRWRWAICLKTWRMGSCCWHCWRSFLGKNWSVSQSLIRDLISSHCVEYCRSFDLSELNHIKPPIKLKKSPGWNIFFYLDCFGHADWTNPWKLHSSFSAVNVQRSYCWSAFIGCLDWIGKTRLEIRDHIVHKITQSRRCLRVSLCQYCLRCKSCVSYWSRYL